MFRRSPRAILLKGSVSRDSAQLRWSRRNVVVRQKTDRLWENWTRIEPAVWRPHSTNTPKNCIHQLQRHSGLGNYRGASSHDFSSSPLLIMAVTGLRARHDILRGRRRHIRAEIEQKENFARTEADLRSANVRGSRNWENEEERARGGERNLSGTPNLDVGGRNEEKQRAGDTDVNQSLLAASDR